MAELTALELAAIRRAAQQLCEANNISYSTITKPIANSAIQAIETWWTDAQTVRPAGSLNAAVNAATSPVTLSNDQKKLIRSCWLDYKARSDEVI